MCLIEFSGYGKIIEFLSLQKKVFGGTTAFLGGHRVSQHICVRKERGDQFPSPHVGLGVELVGGGAECVVQLVEQLVVRPRVDRGDGTSLGEEAEMGEGESMVV